MANYNAGGNRSKSRADHERDGTFRKDRHADLANPEPPPGRPVTPKGLEGLALAEWGRMVARLEACQSLFKTDDAVLFQYCRLFAETEDVGDQRATAVASLQILEENLGDGDLEPADKVALFTQIVALNKTISKCTDQLRQGRMALRQYLVELGQTPASRGRIKLPAKKKELDGFAAFQQAHQLTRVK